MRHNDLVFFRLLINLSGKQEEIMKKKLLMLLVTAALALAALPLAAFADGEVAAIDGQKYLTLQAAVDAVPANNTQTTITLLTSFSESVTIPDGKNIVLALNDQKLTNLNDQDTITNHGTLTVIGAGIVDNVSHQKAALVNYGTAVLNGGQFTRSKEAGTSADESGGNSWYTIFNQGSLTINDGAQVTQKGRFSSLIENGWFSDYPGDTTATLVVNGGTLNGGINAIKNDEGGKATINGGTITGDNSALMNWNIAEVNNGTFSSENGVAVINSYYSDNGAVGQLTIKGGTFTSGKSGANNVFGLGQGAEGTGSIRVEGGTFTGIPNRVAQNDLMILPSATFKDTDGKPLTPPAGTTPVAQVGADYFFTLADALTALDTAENKTLVLSPSHPDVPIEVDAPLVIDVEGVTVRGGILQPSASFARDGSDGSVITVTAKNVTLDSVTVNAGAVPKNEVKYAVQFYNVTGGKVNGGTIKNDGWAGILLNGSTATVTGTAFDLSGSCYAAIELGKGSGVTTDPNLTLDGTVTYANSNTAAPNRLIWVDVDPANDNETIPAGMVTANNLTVKVGAGDMTYDANGLLVAKPAPQPEEPWTPTPTATPAPAAVLDSTPKTGAVSLVALPLAALALAGVGVALRKRR